MEEILKRLEYKTFKKYEKIVDGVKDYVWDYKKPNNIILTNTDGSDYKIIDVWNLPSIKLIECFKN